MSFTPITNTHHHRHIGNDHTLVKEYFPYYIEAIITNDTVSFCKENFGEDAMPSMNGVISIKRFTLKMKKNSFSSN